MRKITKNIFHSLLLGILAIFLNACASQGKDSQNNSNMFDSVLGESIEANKSVSNEKISQQEISDALLPSINLGLKGIEKTATETRFDVKVNRANTREFFMSLVEDTPYNMVLHPEVKGRITLDLKNVTIPEVMDTVRDVFGYDYEHTKSSFRVFPNIMRTRIFSLNYLDIQRSGESHMRVSSGEVTNAQTGDGSSNSNSTSQSDSSSREVVSGSRINTTSKSNFWKGLESSLRAMVGEKDGRSIVVNPQSGIIVVRALSSELRVVEDFITSIQEISQRQVILEAKILEIQLNDDFQAGVNWAALHASNSNNILLGQTGGGSIFDGTSIIDGNTGTLNPSALSQVNNTATSAFGGIFSIALNISNDFAAFIEILETQGDVQVLSSPQISTINNQKAVIKVGTDEFFITDVETTTNSGTATSTTENNVELTPFFSGVALDVIPQISEQGDIILHVHPTVSTVIEQTKNISVSGVSTLSVPLAVSSIRESDSIIRAKDGQVVVIGGLMKNSVTKNNAKIPILGDIPLIGGLFRHSQEISRKSELVILLRPVIIKDGQTWTKSLQQARERFGKF